MKVNTYGTYTDSTVSVSDIHVLKTEEELV